MIYRVKTARVLYMGGGILGIMWLLKIDDGLSFVAHHVVTRVMRKPDVVHVCPLFFVNFSAGKKTNKQRNAT